MSNRRSVSIELVVLAKYSPHVYYTNSFDGDQSNRSTHSMRMNDHVQCQLKPHILRLMYVILSILAQLIVVVVVVLWMLRAYTILIHYSID